MKATVDTWREDLTEAQKIYKKDKKSKLIKIEIETEYFQATKRLSVSEAEELVSEISDLIRWIKEETTRENI